MSSSRQETAFKVSCLAVLPLYCHVDLEWRRSREGAAFLGLLMAVCADF